MTGTIREISVTVGKEVTEGEVVFVMEAMKMEHSIKAPDGGTIKEIYYHDGELVDEGAELIHIN